MKDNRAVQTVPSNIKNIEINLGKACNNKCIFCSTGDPERNVRLAPVSQVRSELRSFASKGFNSVGLLGGEPTIHPHILEIVRYAKELGIPRVHIVTNGRRLSDARFLKELVGAGVDRISVSIHSHKPAVEDALTEVPGGFAQKITGLKNILALQRERGRPIDRSLNICLTKRNTKDLLQTVKYFEKLGYTDFRFNFIQTTGRARKNFLKLVPRYRSVIPVFAQVVNYAVRHHLTVTFGDIPFCLLQGYPEFYRYVGELKDYINLVVILTEKAPDSRQCIPFSWKHRRKNEMKMKPAVCKQCCYDPLCEGVWKEYSRHFGVGELRPC